MMIPKCLWSQDREGHLRLAFQIYGGKDLEYKVFDKKIKFTAKDINNKDYQTELDLFDQVDTQNHNSAIHGQEILITLFKKSQDKKFWPRLLEDSKKNLYIAIDFKRMIDEDEDSEDMNGGMQDKLNMDGFPFMSGIPNAGMGDMPSGSESDEEMDNFENFKDEINDKEETITPNN